MTKEQSVLRVATIEEVPHGFTGCVDFSGSKKEWYVNGQLHREDGPAREYRGGNKVWFQNSMLHRTDGPAVEYASGEKQWWFNGNYYYDNVVINRILNHNYIVIERGIPTTDMFGKLKLTQAKLLAAEGTMFIYDNLPGFDLLE